MRLQKNFKAGDQRDLNDQIEENKDYEILEKPQDELWEPPQIEDYAPGIIE